MSAEENKAIVCRYLTAHAANDPGILDELLAPDFIGQHATTSLNREALLHSVYTYSEVFSDRKFTVKDQIAEGDKVVTRCTWRGIHTGDFLGLAPTGKQTEISVFFVQRIRDGRIVEQWFLFDQLGMMQQLGLVPPPPSSK
jgi:steroid delta-isomerase-like uncharacterized protein